MLTEQEAAGIIAHMNNDHADAVLLYATVFGGQPGAQSAQLTGISEASLRICCVVDQHDVVVDVALPEPMLTIGDARRVLIQFARSARQQLAEH